MLQRIILLLTLTISTGTRPATAASLITSENRQHISSIGNMYGGWGPHLRGIMRDSKDRLWLAIDQGSDVYNNNTINYFRYQNGVWDKATSLTQLPGIQQNVSSLMLSGNVILSYGISTTQHLLEECYLYTDNLSLKACNNITISGRPYVLDSSANYIGSAVGPDGVSRVVWWTVVGSKGGSGKLQYIYNFGGGWNGPITSNLGGYNDIGYMYGSLSSDYIFTGTAQFWYGGYPSGYAQATGVQFKLGNSAYYSILSAKSSDCISSFSIKTGSDIYVDAKMDVVHALAETSDYKLAYFHGKYSTFIKEGLTLKYVFQDGFRGRFVAEGNLFHLVVGGDASPKINVYTVTKDSTQKAIDWRKSAKNTLTNPYLGKTGPVGAIYLETGQHGIRPAQGLHIAAVGVYTANAAETFDKYITYFNDNDASTTTQGTVKALTSTLFPVGSLCGLETYNIYNGWSRGAKCGTSYPSQSCPTGFSKSEIATNGGINKIITCSQKTEKTPVTLGQLCGLSHKNIPNASTTQASSCGGYNPAVSCPQGYQQVLAIQNGGYDITYSCAVSNVTSASPALSGVLCGITNYNIYNGLSANVACQMKDSEANFTELLKVDTATSVNQVMNGGIDYLKSCTKK